jgi:hypothetical protein
MNPTWIVLRFVLLDLYVCFVDRCLSFCSFYFDSSCCYHTWLIGAGTADTSGSHEFTPCFSGVHVNRSLIVCFADRCLSFCAFSFGHCFVCYSSIYGFWLPLWYLQTLLIGVVYGLRVWCLTPLSTTFQ